MLPRPYTMPLQELQMRGSDGVPGEDRVTPGHGRRRDRQI